MKKKGAAKKTAVKKVVAKKKAVIKKKAPAKKKASVKKSKPASTAVKTSPEKKRAIKRTAKKIEQEQTVASLPPVEEKSTEIKHAVTENLSGMDQKALQRAAVRNYDNHHLRLSNTKKGGPKPTGKKPLW